jgi:hypothetical protein
MYKDAFDMTFRKVRGKIEFFLLISKTVGRFLNVLISLSHMHADYYCVLCST